MSQMHCNVSEWVINSGRCLGLNADNQNLDYSACLSRLISVSVYLFVILSFLVEPCFVKVIQRTLVITTLFVIKDFAVKSNLLL